MLCRAPRLRPSSRSLETMTLHPLGKVDWLRVLGSSCLTHHTTLLPHHGRDRGGRVSGHQADPNAHHASPRLKGRVALGPSCWRVDDRGPTPLASPTSSRLLRKSPCFSHAALHDPQGQGSMPPPSSSGSFGGGPYDLPGVGAKSPAMGQPPTIESLLGGETRSSLLSKERLRIRRRCEYRPCCSQVADGVSAIPLLRGAAERELRGGPQIPAQFACAARSSMPNQD